MNKTNFPLISFSSPENAPLSEFLESCLRHKSELVIYEAARALVNLKNVKSKDLDPAVSGITNIILAELPTFIESVMFSPVFHLDWVS